MQLSSSSSNVQSPSIFLCRSASNLPPEPRTKDEGVQIIMDILRKVVLCRHDIININRVYDQMSKREDFNAHSVGESLKPKLIELWNVEEEQIHSFTEIVKGVLDKKVTKPNHSVLGIRRISFYYFKTLAHERLTLLISDLHIKEETSPTTGELEVLAESLPDCSTIEDFESDVSALIGSQSEQNRNVKEILEQKREFLQRKSKTYEQIKKVRETLRSSSMQSLPTYLSKLLEDGYVNLVEYLDKVMRLTDRNERRLKVGEMSFDMISRVILETRDAICDKVENSLVAYNAQILFLLGSSGAGKSTTLCALRGDRMEYKSGRYESPNDNAALIGHELANSCTFLPTVESVKGWIVVDFPGFDDTNGPLITLGMECALKALVRKYNPYILVVESITNDQSKYANAANLGLKLKRLFEDKSKCVLGITKYSEEPNSIHIKNLEQKDQRKLLEESPEERGLVVEIAALKKLREKYGDGILPDLREKEQKLAELKQVPRQPPMSSNSKEIEDHREKVKSKEDRLKKEIGLEKFIRLCNLEDTLQTSDLLNQLSALCKFVKVSSEQKLDASDVDLLNERFQNSLLTEIGKMQDFSREYEDFDAFERSVMENSLIGTLFAHSHPEIGRFLHLPEIDPEIVRSYDKIIVEGCITKYMHFVINTIDLSLIEILKIQKFAQELSKEIAKLEKKINELKEHVSANLSGLSFKKDPEEAKAKWVDMRKKRQEETQDNNDLPWWAKRPFPISNNAFNRLNSWLENRVREKVERNVFAGIIKELTEEVDKMYDALLRLQVIKTKIEKQNVFEETLKSVLIDINSIEKVKKSINQCVSSFAKTYGIEWDKRVSNLAKRSVLEGFNDTDAHKNCILAYALWLIEPSVQCVYQVEMNSKVVKFLSKQLDVMKGKLDPLTFDIPSLQNTSKEILMLSDSNVRSLKVAFLRNAIREKGQILREIEDAALKETEKGIEFFANKNDGSEAEIFSSFARAIGETASLAEQLAKKDTVNIEDLNELSAKIDQAMTIISINDKKKAVVTSWTSWNRALAKAQKAYSSMKIKRSGHESCMLTVQKMTDSGDGQKRVPYKLVLTMGSVMPELSRDIRDKHDRNPLIRTLYAAALLELHHISL